MGKGVKIYMMCRINSSRVKLSNLVGKFRVGETAGSQMSVISRNYKLMRWLSEIQRGSAGNLNPYAYSEAVLKQGYLPKANLKIDMGFRT